MKKVQSMSAIKDIMMKRVIPGIYALVFIVALLLISLVLERRHLYL